MTTNTKTSTSGEPRTYLCPVKEPLFDLHVKSGKHFSSVTKQFHKEKSDLADSFRTFVALMNLNGVLSFRGDPRSAGTI